MEALASMRWIHKDLGLCTQQLQWGCRLRTLVKQGRMHAADLKRRTLECLIDFDLGAGDSLRWAKYGFGECGFKHQTLVAPSTG